MTRGRMAVVTMDCPWCEAEEPLSLAALEASEATFTCPECGTSVSFVEEPEPVLEAAA